MFKIFWGEFYFYIKGGMINQRLGLIITPVVQNHHRPIAFVDEEKAINLHLTWLL